MVHPADSLAGVSVDIEGCAAPAGEGARRGDTHLQSRAGVKAASIWAQAPRQSPQQQQAAAVQACLSPAACALGGGASQAVGTKAHGARGGAGAAGVEALVVPATAQSDSVAPPRDCQVLALAACVLGKRGDDMLGLATCSPGGAANVTVPCLQAQHTLLPPLSHICYIPWQCTRSLDSSALQWRNRRTPSCGHQSDGACGWGSCRRMWPRCLQGHGCRREQSGSERKMADARQHLLRVPAMRAIACMPARTYQAWIARRLDPPGRWVAWRGQE